MKVITSNNNNNNNNNNMALITQGTASRSSHPDLLNYCKLWNRRSLWNIVEIAKQELSMGSRI